MAGGASQIPSHEVPPWVQRNPGAKRQLLDFVERLLHWGFLNA